MLEFCKILFFLFIFVVSYISLVHSIPSIRVCCTILQLFWNFTAIFLSVGRSWGFVSLSLMISISKGFSYMEYFYNNLFWLNYARDIVDVTFRLGSRKLIPENWLFSSMLFVKGLIKMAKGVADREQPWDIPCSNWISGICFG